MLWKVKYALLTVYFHSLLVMSVIVYVSLYPGLAFLNLSLTLFLLAHCFVFFYNILSQMQPHEKAEGRLRGRKNNRVYILTGLRVRRTAGCVEPQEKDNRVVKRQKREIRGKH